MNLHPRSTTQGKKVIICTSYEITFRESLHMEHLASSILAYQKGMHTGPGIEFLSRKSGGERRFVQMGYPGSYSLFGRT